MPAPALMSRLKYVVDRTCELAPLYLNVLVSSSRVPLSTNTLPVPERSHELAPATRKCAGLMVSRPEIVVVAVPDLVVVPTTEPLPSTKLAKVQALVPPKVLVRLMVVVPEPNDNVPSPESEPLVKVTLLVPVTVPVATSILPFMMSGAVIFQPPPTPVNCTVLKVTVFGLVILLPVVVALNINVEEADVSVEVVAKTNRPASV